jgi:uncharacterized membrane protein
VEMIKRTVICFLILMAVFTPLALAQSDSPEEEILEAEVVKILEEEEKTVMGKSQLYQKLELIVTKGSLTEKTIIVESGNLSMVNLPQYQVGDRVLVSYSQDFEGQDVFYITDFVRQKPLLWLFFLFIILTVLIARWRGISSLLGMGFSFLIIFKLILPQILAGSNPILVAMVGSLFIIPVTFYLSHGFNRKTTVAVGGTLVALIATGLLAGFSVNAAKLTGFASEEAGFLQTARPGLINMKGLLLAGMMIGVLGVLDDITVSQAAIVEQLKKANKKLKYRTLYQKAMDVGKDHIASMVNTLILVYAGAALPLFLLFLDNPQPFSQVINYELIADEIVRTLVGSIGLVLAVPVTTLLACWAVEKR